MRRLWFGVALGMGGLAACSGDNGTGVIGSGQGHIVYGLPNGDLYRIQARPGAIPQNVSAALDALSPGSDEWIATTFDGTFFLLGRSIRLHPDCDSAPCLVLVHGDLTASETIQVGGAGGDVIHPKGPSAVGRAFIPGVAAGSFPPLVVVVYEAEGVGPNARDLWMVQKTIGSDVWTTPIALTTASPFPFNSQPTISADGRKVVFDCGSQPFGAEGTSICEVETDGSNFRVVARPQDSPPGLPDVGALHHPAYAADGSILFEADWAGAQIWRLPSGSTTPVRIAAPVTNDNSPCVLPDGRIASLWLSRAGNPSGLHELKVMTSNGSGYFMALTLVDVADIGISCGN